MGNQIYHLLYRSIASGYIGPSVIEAILARSQANNSMLKVSGLLVYRTGNFIQLLEGEKSAVKKLYETIRKDRRHADSKILLEFESDARIFPNWSMAHIQDDELSGKLSQSIEQFDLVEVQNGVKGRATVIAILKEFNSRVEKNSNP
jgi:hypothetical protein